MKRILRRLRVWIIMDYEWAFGDLRRNLKVPWRTPYAVIDALADYIKGKSICEIGSACGDILIYMRDKYHCKVTGIEISKRRVDISRKKGLHVIHGDALKCELPICDVYYFWIGPYDPQAKLIEKITKGTIITLNLKEAEKA
jgi:16S rRNA A1518/A1519 N6-dimethyltransferase RsmA/KsgA/DIM1 with predicted DNA glycosylase/AP lyase activity